MKISTGILYTDYFHYMDNSVFNARLVTSVYVGIDLPNEPIYHTEVINNYDRVTGFVFYEER
jgi:hypothetical protein